jgi:hypothetical protein
VNHAVTTTVPPRPVSPSLVAARPDGPARRDAAVRLGAAAGLWPSLLPVASWWAAGGGFGDLGGWQNGLTSLGAPAAGGPARAGHHRPGPGPGGGRPRRDRLAHRLPGAAAARRRRGPPGRSHPGQTLETCPSPFADGLDPRVVAALARYRLPQDLVRRRLLELMRNLHRLNVLATYRALESAEWDPR